MKLGKDFVLVQKKTTVKSVQPVAVLGKYVFINEI